MPSDPGATIADINKGMVLTRQNKIRRVAESFFNCPFHTRKDITAFANYIQSLPENLGENPYPLFHSFADGVYSREIHIPAGHIAVGKLHRLEGMVYVMKGKLLIADEFETKMVTAPAKISSKAGVKRIVYIIEDTVWMDIHHTNKTTVEEAEKELFADSYEDLESDYLAMLGEIGFTKEQAKRISEIEHDVITDEQENIEIRDSVIEGKGVFTLVDIKPGEVIGEARIVNKRTLIGRYTNHSDNPNAKPELSKNKMLFIATKNISADTEITVDYRCVRHYAQKLDRRVNFLGGELCHMQ